MPRRLPGTADLAKLLLDAESRIVDLTIWAMTPLHHVSSSSATLSQPCFDAAIFLCKENGNLAVKQVAGRVQAPFRPIFVLALAMLTVMTPCNPLPRHLGLRHSYVHGRMPYEVDR